MKIIPVEQRSDEWVEFRRGKISGTMLGDLYSKRGGRKIGFYQVLSERLGLAPDFENRMDRGLRLEDEAIELFTNKTKLKVERVGVCVSDISDSIINSPDGLIKSKKGKYTQAIEVKCLSPARHLQAVVENIVPAEFESQVVQYFCVNPDLEKLHLCFYDPRIPSIPFHVIQVNRESIEDKIKFFIDWQLNALVELKELEEKLSW